MRGPLLAALATLTASTAAAQGTPLDVSLAHGDQRELATRDQLLGLLARYQLTPWLFTRTVRIDRTEIPHSHPVLTLHTQHLGDDDALLSTFIHEEFHWLANDRQAAVARATARFRTLYPEVPAREAGGARDDRSTYLHLVVCDLELQGLTRLVGAERARRTLAGMNHYQWIYDKVLHDPRVREVNQAEGLVVPDGAAPR